MSGADAPVVVIIPAGYGCMDIVVMKLQTVSRPRLRRFSTTQAARICAVNPNSIISWVDKGLLQAEVTPGGHRRISEKSLVLFLKKRGFDVPAELNRSLPRVLIVEDDAECKQLLVRALAKIPSINVATCSDGLEALVSIGADPPDLLILDIFLPKMDGFQVCRILRAVPKTASLKIIVVSGKPLSEKEQAFLSKHCEGLFRKPFAVEDLKRQVSDLLNSCTSG